MISSTILKLFYSGIFIASSFPFPFIDILCVISITFICCFSFSSAFFLLLFVNFFVIQNVRMRLFKDMNSPLSELFKLQVRSLNLMSSFVTENDHFLQKWKLAYFYQFRYISQSSRVESQVYYSGERLMSHSIKYI